MMVKREKGKRKITVLLLAAGLLLLSVSTAPACRLWGMINAGPFPDSAYTVTIERFRDLSVYQRNGWGILGFAVNQAGPVVYRTTANAADEWENRGDGGIPSNWVPDVNYDGYPDQLYLAIAHARSASTGRGDIPNPHPFVYRINGRTLGMIHNGTLPSGWWLTTRALIGDEYWAMDLFDREWRGNEENYRREANDSELYAMLLMKNILIADNYRLGDSWAIRKTLSLLRKELGLGGGKNILFTNGSELYAVRDYGAALRYSQNSIVPTNWCVMSDNSPPVNHAGFTNWTSLSNIGEYVILTGDTAAQGPFPIEDVATPESREYIINSPSATGELRPVVASGPQGDFVVAWESAADHSIKFRHLDQMGLGEELPSNVAANPHFHAARPDIAFDMETNDFYIVYQQKPARSDRYNRIILKQYEYLPETGNWRACRPVTVNDFTNFTVAEPAVAVGDETVAVAWQQLDNEDRGWKVRARVFFGEQPGNEAAFGNLESGIHQRHPDIAYLGGRRGDPRFIVAFNQAGDVEGVDGVYVAHFTPASPSPRDLYRAHQVNAISYHPELALPVLAISRDVIACTYLRKPNRTISRIATQFIHNPAYGDVRSDWYQPFDTHLVNFFSENDSVSSDLSVAPRPGGGFDLAFACHRLDEQEQQIMVAQVESTNIASSEPFGWSQELGNVYDRPSIAVAPDFLGGDTHRRIVVWQGDGLDEAGADIVARFSRDHFQAEVVPLGGATEDEKRPETPGEFVPVMPGEFRLLPVYPNPFNSTAQIAFDLPEESTVELVVYDLQGRLVKSWTQREFSAGRHQVTFSADNLTSGMYFVRLSTPKFSGIRKVLLVK